MQDLLLLTKALKRRGFDVDLCEDGNQARGAVERIIGANGPAGSVGFGNSETIRNLGLYETMSRHTPNIYIHEPGVGSDDDRKALTADYYFTSANAVSLDGQIVNIDGTGNRTAATCFGPKRVIYVIGRNKVAATLEEALLRAKQAAVKLAQKNKRKTPCALTGECSDCLSPECVCAITTIHRKKPLGTDMSVILINEDLGL